MDYMREDERLVVMELSYHSPRPIDTPYSISWAGDTLRKFKERHAEVYTTIRHEPAKKVARIILDVISGGGARKRPPTPEQRRRRELHELGVNPRTSGSRGSSYGGSYGSAHGGGRKKRKTKKRRSRVDPEFRVSDSVAKEIAPLTWLVHSRSERRRALQLAYPGRDTSGWDVDKYDKKAALFLGKTEAVIAEMKKRGTW